MNFSTERFESLVVDGGNGYFTSKLCVRIFLLWATLTTLICLASIYYSLETKSKVHDLRSVSGFEGSLGPNYVYNQQQIQDDKGGKKSRKKKRLKVLSF